MRISYWSSDVCSSDLLFFSRMSLLPTANNILSCCQHSRNKHVRASNNQHTRLHVTTHELFRTSRAFFVPFSHAPHVFQRSVTRSAERRVGNSCGGTFGSRW